MSGPAEGEQGSEDGADGPLDVDARFAAIVARFHEGEPSRPEIVDSPEDPEDRTVDLRGTQPQEPSPHPAPHPARRHGDEKQEQGGRSESAAPQRRPAPDEDEIERVQQIEREIERAVHGADGGRYVPPEPPPLPRPDLPGRLAWSAVLLGPLLLLLAAALWQSAPQWLVGAVVVGIVVGFGYLVSRLPRSRDHDDPGDGAIV